MAAVVYSNTQAGVLELSSGASEMRALSNAAFEAVFARHVLEEFGVRDVIPIIYSDTTAAFANTEKLGPGRMTLDGFGHVVRRRQVRLGRIDKNLNIAGAATNRLGGEKLETHLECFELDG
jgi:hypothetical protein